jgi:hypothetical protein
VHLILDNYATHKHPKARQRLDRHPHFTFHFRPTSCSWLNAVEGFFAKLAKRRLNRGVFRCVVDLQAAVNRFVAETNHDPEPFTWTADPDKIIAAVRRGHQVLDSIHLFMWSRDPATTDTAPSSLSARQRSTNDISILASPLCLGSPPEGGPYRGLAAGKKGAKC